MTIKELENRTGMTRANIRFYEGEGLVSPKRLDNGYRDYSEEDVHTLEKIKLLRQLQLDIDTIRKVQQGALTLEQALFVQATKLEGDRAVIERAETVCRELERQGVEYAALDPKPYLQRLEAPRREALSPPPPASPGKDEENWEPRACYHPWQRYFARALDMGLYDTVLNVGWLLVTRDQSFIRVQNGGIVVRFLFGLLSLGFALAVEPLWLHHWGWTPGKWVFGLKVRDVNGDKLSIGQGLDRSWAIFKDGYGWDIPVLNLWKMWQARKLGLDGKDCYWDHDECYRYTKVKRRVHGGWFFVGAQVLCFGLLFGTMLWSTVPPCRGPLDLPEFARNYNHNLRVQTAGEDSYEPTLDAEGRWVERKQEPGVVVMFLDETAYDEPEFTVEDGRVTAVTLHMESRFAYVGSGFRETMAAVALEGSVDGLSMFNIQAVIRDAYGLLSQWEDLEVDFYGLHISQQAEYTGYAYSHESGSLWPEDAQTPRHCEKTVTISLIK